MLEIFSWTRWCGPALLLFSSPAQFQNWVFVL